MCTARRTWLTFILVTSMTGSPTWAQHSMSVQWEKQISAGDRSLTPYTLQVDPSHGTLRIVGVSYLFRKNEKPRYQDPQLFEYRLNLENQTSERKTLMAMNPEDITLPWLLGNILDTRKINGKIWILRQQYRSKDFQELSIGSDWKVHTREIPGLTRNSVSTHGACRNIHGDVFLCGNSGYIRKISPDGTVAWDTNYQSHKKEDGTLAVAFSEAEQELMAFGFSFTPDTKFTTKDSSLWLATLDTDGHFQTKRPFEGIVNLGMNPSFALDQSDHAIVAYHTMPEPNSVQCNITRFSHDLKTMLWSVPIYRTQALTIQKLTTCESNRILLSLTTMSTQERAFRLYYLDDKGQLLSQFQSRDLFCSEYVITSDRKYVYLAISQPDMINKTMIQHIKLVRLKL